MPEFKRFFSFDVFPYADDQDDGNDDDDVNEDDGGEVDVDDEDDSDSEDEDDHQGRGHQRECGHLDGAKEGDKEVQPRHSCRQAD